MSGWLLPAAASAFWAGLLAWSLHPAWLRPWMGIAIGASASIGAWLAVPPPAKGPGARVRLWLEPDEPAPVAILRPELAVSGGVPPAAIALALLGVWSIGAGWAGLAEARTLGELPARLASRNVTAVGTLASDPHRGGFGWFAVVDLSRLDWGSGAATLRAPVWAEWSGDPTDAVRGDQVQLDGQLRLPDDPDFAASLLHQGIPATLSADRLERLGPAPNPLVHAAQVTRAFVGRSIQHLFGPREAGLLLGLVLGDDRGLDPGVARDFQASGLGHLLVVSGENVAMVLAPVLAAAVVLRLGGRARLLLGVGTVLFFTVLTGGEPSVLRAGVMATLTLVGVVLGRPRHGGSVLAGAVLVLLVIDPWLVWSVGFRLSVAATAGMVAMAGALTARLRFLPAPLALAAGATLAAQIGVAPVLLSQFRAVPLVSLPANLLAFPAVAPALLLGIAAAGLGLVSHPLGAIVAMPASTLLRYLEWLADRSAKAPLPSITSGGGIGVLLVAGAVVVAVAWWIRSPRRLPRAVATGVLIAAPVLVWAIAIRAGPPGGLRIVFLDVGQGDAALIESPAGAHVLIDGGPDETQVATDLASLRCAPARPGRRDPPARGSHRGPARRAVAVRGRGRRGAGMRA